MDIRWPLGGVVARCAHGAAPFLCFWRFYPVKRPTTNHSGRCSQMLVDGRQRPLDDASCISKLCTVRARCVPHPLNRQQLLVFGTLFGSSLDLQHSGLPSNGARRWTLDVPCTPAHPGQSALHECNSPAIRGAAQGQTAQGEKIWRCIQHVYGYIRRARTNACQAQVERLFRSTTVLDIRNTSPHHCRLLPKKPNWVFLQKPRST